EGMDNVYDPSDRVTVPRPRLVSSTLTSASGWPVSLATRPVSTVGSVDWAIATPDTTAPRNTAAALRCRERMRGMRCTPLTIEPGPRGSARSGLNGCQRVQSDACTIMWSLTEHRPT